MPGIIQRERALSAAVLSLPDVEGEAERIITAAEEQARRVLAAAESRGRIAAEACEAEARRLGHEEGRQAGLSQALTEARQTALTEARANLNALTAALSAAAREYESAKHQLFSEAEAGLITLAVAIARRVCKLAAADNADVARANVRAALELVRHVGDLELHLNPAQCELLAEVAEAAAHELGKGRHVRIVADAAVAAGGCRLIAGEGSIDTQIETQLDRIAACLSDGRAADPQLTGGPA